MVIEAEQNFEAEHGGTGKARRIRKFVRSKQERACRLLGCGHASGERRGREVSRNARKKGSRQSSTTKSKTEQKNDPVKEKLSREEFRTKVVEKEWETNVLVCWNSINQVLGGGWTRKGGEKKSA